MPHRILFFVLRNLHLPHLLPIYSWMRVNHSEVYELAFSAAPFSGSTDENPGYGLDETQLTSLRQDCENIIAFDEITNWRPDVIVMADSDYRGGIAELGAKIVNVNHGLISKGAFYTDSPLAERDNLADLICVPGTYHRDRLKRVVSKPISVTGLVKFDTIWNGEIERDIVLKDLAIDPTKKIILFAPTFNRELSAVPLVADTVTRWIDEDKHLIIKLHGMSPPDWKELYRLISEINDRISYVDDLNLTPLLVASDVMVSDVSSAFMEFMALDKPVVLVDNPLRTSFIGFDPRDVEYAWRDVGLATDNPDEIQQLIQRSIENPDEKSDLRMKYSDRLVGPRDGRASERVAMAIKGIL